MCSKTSKSNSIIFLFVTFPINISQGTNPDPMLYEDPSSVLYPGYLTLGISCLRVGSDPGFYEKNPGFPRLGHEPWLKVGSKVANLTINNLFKLLFLLPNNNITPTYRLGTIFQNTSFDISSSEGTIPCR